MSVVTGIDYDKLAAAILRAGEVDGASGRGGVVAGVVRASGVRGASGRGDAVAGVVAAARVVAAAGVAGEGAEAVAALGLGGDACADGVGAGRAAAGLVGGGEGCVADEADWEGFEAVESGAGEEELSAVESVSGGSVGEVSAEVRESVRFGGIGDVFPDVIERGRELNGVKNGGFYRSVVRRGEARALRSWLLTKGVKLPKLAALDLAVCTFTSATMPEVIANGKLRLRTLAALGDATLTQLLVLAAASRGETVESMQAIRSRVASDKSLMSVCWYSGLSEMVTYGSGVNPQTVKTSATALEAVLGVVSVWRPVGDGVSLMRSLGLL